MKKWFWLYMVLLASFPVFAETTSIIEPSVIFSAPLSFEHGRIFLPILVNGSGPFYCILDTGAPINALDESIVQSLSIVKRGEIQVSGGGENSQTQGHFLEDFTLGFPHSFFSLRHQKSIAIPMKSMSRYFGRPLEGIIGFPLFSRVVIEVDFEMQVVRFHAPHLFKPPTNCQRIAMNTKLGVPVLPLTLQISEKEELTCSLMLDTGAGGIGLNTPFVAKHSLLQKIQPTVQGFEGGLGKMASCRLGRISSINFGGVTLKKPIISLSLTKEGVNATPDFDGLFGLDILKRFRVFFDYRSKCLYLQPQTSVSLPFHTDMAGVFFVGKEENLKTLMVEKVRADSPASKAGIQPGDILQEINGISAHSLQLKDLPKFFEHEGKSVQIKVLRDLKTLSFIITLEEMI
ncbi:MAG: aspartyl protease family protein [Candidatus Ozemobacteraceae bacterium]